MDDELEGSQDARVKSLWESLDFKGRGQLDFEALKEGLKKIDHPLKNADELLKDVIRAVDTNGDGRIQYQEFSAFVRHAEKQLWVFFKSIDCNQTNKLSKEELKDAFNRSGISVSNVKLEEFFTKVDVNHDGVISFDEWRNFLLFIPAHVPGLNSVLSYFSASVKVNPEGDVHVSDETIEGLGTTRQFFSPLFRIFNIITTQPIRQRPSTVSLSDSTVREVEVPSPRSPESVIDVDGVLLSRSRPPTTPPTFWEKWKPVLTALLPKPGYFLAGGIAGIVSRTSTAPLDRLKVYLIAQTGTASKAAEAIKHGAAVQATKHAARPLVDASVALWRAGGIRNLFAGNGLNVVKVMPESAIKFGSYEASKRIIATLEGHGDPQRIHPWSKFVAGGMGGIISQFFVYPIDTLKFRMQCETVEGGLYGNKLIISTAKKMWIGNGLRSFYRGLPMGLVGMFPYSAIDLGTFEYLKRMITSRRAIKRGCHEDDAAPGSVATAAIGGLSGALGATSVYPLNLLRTRLQTQGTVQHPRTYTGIVDVTRKTIQGEGVRGLFKGLTPNLLKVVPAVSITYVVYENSKKALHLT